MTSTLSGKRIYRLGIISDTHGYLPDQALRIFSRVDMILHAGDVGSETILSTLAKIAPVVAVRGNMDSGAWADRLIEKESVEVGGRLIHLIHDAARLRMGALNGTCVAVVNGHTHRPAVATREGVLFVNPGSAGAPRYGERASVAILQIEGARVSADLVDLAG